jgi:hypothetical protein
MGGNCRDPDGWALPPALFGECKEGCIPISMHCPLCKRVWTLDIATIEGDDAMPVNALARRYTWECGRRGGLGASPEHRKWVQWLRKTGQQARLPYTAAFVRDED